MFGDITFIIINLLITLCDVLLAFVLMDSFFEYKFQKNHIKYISAVSAGCILFAVSFADLSYIIKIIAEILLITALLFALYSGKIKYRILYCALWTVMLTLSNIVSDIIIKSVPKEMIFLADKSLFTALMQLILPKILLMIFIFVLSGIIKDKDVKVNFKSWLIILSVTIITIADMAMIRFYMNSAPVTETNFTKVTSVTANGIELTIRELTPRGYSIISVIGLLFINILVFILFIRVQKANEVQAKYNLITKQTEMQNISIKKLENSYTRMRELRHDMQNQLIIVNSLLENEKYDDLKHYIKTIINTVDEAAFMRISGQSAVDAILNEKLLSAHKNRIATSFDIPNLENIFAEPLDLCVILANALDNAVEACIKLSENEEKYIILKITNNENFILISCTNPSNSAPKKKNSEIISSKEDRKNHGFGLKSIKNTAEKYNGDYMVRYRDGEFTLIVKLNNE